MKLSDLAPGACEDAFRAWRAGSGAMWPYVRSTPFVSLARFAGDLELEPGVPDRAEVPDTAADELVVLDLPASQAAAAGLRLWAEQGRWPVVTFSHWYHPRGLVGDAATAALLLLHPPAERPEGAAGWSLLLDAGRYREEPLTPDQFNNQYELTEDDLPTAEELLHLGMTGVCLVTGGPPKEDLRRYAAYLEGAQVKVRWAM